MFSPLPDVTENNALYSAVLWVKHCRGSIISHLVKTKKRDSGYLEDFPVQICKYFIYFVHNISEQLCTMFYFVNVLIYLKTRVSTNTVSFCTSSSYSYLHLHCNYENNCNCVCFNFFLHVVYFQYQLSGKVSRNRQAKRLDQIWKKKTWIRASVTVFRSCILSHLLGVCFQLLFLDLEDVLNVVHVSSRLPSELGPHLGLHHFPHFRKLQHTRQHFGQIDV